MATNIKDRVQRLEAGRINADMQAMTDTQLDDHITTLEFGSRECYRAVVTKVLRHPSAMPIVHDAPLDSHLCEATKPVNPQEQYRAKS